MNTIKFPLIPFFFFKEQITEGHAILYNKVKIKKFDDRQKTKIKHLRKENKQNNKQTNKQTNKSLAAQTLGAACQKRGLVCPNIDKSAEIYILYLN